MKRRRKKLTIEQRAALRAALGDVQGDLRAMRGIFERILARMAESEALETRRKERLRRLTFGLLGRS